MAIAEVFLHIAQRHSTSVQASLEAQACTFYVPHLWRYG
jgi:hypothetical protein